jgi:hypothetical protein
MAVRKDLCVLSVSAFIGVLILGQAGVPSGSGLWMDAGAVIWQFVFCLSAGFIGDHQQLHFY